MDPATANKQTGDKSGACSQCVEKCRREHHSRTAASVSGHFTSAPRHPCFLRTALEHNLRSNMSIPKAFMEVHGKNLHGCTVDLEGANGNVWLVTVDSTSRGVSGFRFGWQVFAADNNLKAGDSLLFTMVSKNRFRVRVFNRIGLEFDVPGKPTKTINSSYTTRVSKFTRESQSRGLHINLEDESDEFIDTARGTYSGTSGFDQSIHKGFRAMDSGEGHGGQGPSIQEILKSHGYQTEEPNRREIRDKSKRPKRHRKANHRNQQGEALDPGWNSTVWESRRRLVTDGERQRAVTASEELVTARPSISVLMKPSHVYRGFWLSIPLEFSRQHLPSMRVHITLQDTFGYQWPAKWVVSGHHSGVSGGWAAFSRDHQLEEGDVCVFEVLDSMKDCIILVHIFRVVDVPLKPGSRGGWDAAYNVIFKRQSGDPSGSFSPTDHGYLPVLNEELPHGFTVKTELPTDGNLRKRPRLAQALHKMVRNGQFSKQQRVEDFSSKVRALTENGMLDEKEKLDIKSPELLIAGEFRRPVLHRPIYLSTDSVKAEPEDVYPMTPIKSLPALAEVKTEPNFVVKVEDMSAKSPIGSISPIAVYPRRHRKEGSSSTASKSTESEKDVDERVLYPVVRVIQKRQRKNKEEQDILVEIQGAAPENRTRSDNVVRRGHDGFWWVPSSRFSTDYSSCYFN